MATAYAIPNVADDDETSDESTLVGSLKAEDTLVGDLPKVHEDEDDATSDETTLVNDTPSIAPKAKARSSEIRELRPAPTAPTAKAGPPPRPASTKKPARAGGKPSLVKPAPKAEPKVEAKKKAEIPKIIPQPAGPPIVQPVAQSEPPPAPVAVPVTAPAPARGPVMGAFDTAPFLKIVKPEAPGEIASSPLRAPAPPDAEADLSDEALTLELTMSPLARVGHVLLASVLFFWYALRGMAAWIASYARPYWRKALDDAAARVHRR